MDRRSFITGLAASTAALAHTGLAQASTSEAFSKKTRPVDTMNRIGGWTNGSVEVIDIKGVRIGEGRPKLIAPTTSKTEADLIATVRKFADMPALNVIEVRIDYLGKIDPKDYARITRDAYAAAGDKVVLVTLRNGTDGGPFIADDEWYGRVYEAVLTEGRADIVDLELFRDRAMIDRLVKLARQQGVKVIISDHEFNFTPDEDEINPPPDARRTGRRRHPQDRRHGPQPRGRPRGDERHGQDAPLPLRPSDAHDGHGPCRRPHPHHGRGLRQRHDVRERGRQGLGSGPDPGRGLPQGS